jgi:hypothetical protein
LGFGVWEFLDGSIICSDLVKEKEGAVFIQGAEAQQLELFVLEVGYGKFEGDCSGQLHLLIGESCFRVGALELGELRDHAVEGKIR